MSKFGSYACHLSKSQTVRLWMSSIISIANDRLQLTHPSTHPQVGVSAQITNLQTELNYLDYVQNLLHLVIWYPLGLGDVGVGESPCMHTHIKHTKPDTHEGSHLQFLNTYFFIACMHMHACMWGHTTCPDTPIHGNLTALWITL